MELGHRRGWILPIVMVALLLPTSLVRGPDDREAAAGLQNWFATGDVPEEIRAIENPDHRGRGQRLHFVKHDDRVRIIPSTAGMTGSGVPDAVRSVLDAGEPAVTVTPVPVGMRFPGRSMLFALLATSSLTGALSASVGGERSNRTLVALLTGGITRLEIVLGKWGAWGGFGAFSALLAATIALVFGRVELGWWLIPLPWVPLATVAMGLWLVRRSTDVVAGSAVSLRVLPAALTVAGLAAWFLGRVDPHLGAIVPLGGALIASGDTWPDTPTAPILAAAVSLLLCALWLLRTASDLDEQPAGDLPESPDRLMVVAATIGAACWWAPLGMALLWREAGNPLLGNGLPLEAGVGAGALGLGCYVLVRGGRHPHPARGLGLMSPMPGVVFAAIFVGIALGAVGSGTELIPLTGTVADFRSRMAAAWVPTVGGPVLMVVTTVVDELLFRGWLQRSAGPGRAAVAWTIVKAPLDPLYGLLVAAGLGAIASRGGVLAAVVARVSLVVAVTTLQVPRPAAVVVAVVIVGAAVAWSRRG